MDRFKAKITKMGDRKIISVPKVILDYFEIGQEVEVQKTGSDKNGYSTGDKNQT